MADGSFKRLFRSLFMREMIKFYIIGATGVIVNLSVLYIVTEFTHYPPIVGLCCGIILATTTNFCGNKLWTFKDSQKSEFILFQYGKYWLSSFPGILLQIALFQGMLTIFPKIGYVSSGLVAIAIASFFNFLLNKFWVFKAFDSSQTDNKTQTQDQKDTKNKMIVYFLIVILFIAFCIRVFNNTPSLNSYWLDEAEYSNRAIYITQHNWAYNPDFLVDHPPLFMYFLSVFYYFLGSAWYVGRGVVVGLGVLTTLICYYIGREMKDEKLGLILASVFGFALLSTFVNREVLLETMTVLFMLLSFLFLFKYDKIQNPSYLAASIIFMSLSIDTKFTALIMLVPFIIYFLQKKLFAKKLGWISIVVFLLIVVPVVAIMLPHGFISFHMEKTTDSVYFMGQTEIRLYNFAAIVMTVAWVNIGLIPVFSMVYGYYKDHKKIGFVDSLKTTLRMNPMWTFVIVWFLSSIICFSALQFMQPHYIYYIFVPLIPVIGIGIYRNFKWLKFILVFYLLISIGYFAMTRYQGPNDAMEYLSAHTNKNDTIVASDISFFKYYFPDNVIVFANASTILMTNATFIVLNANDHTEFTKNASITAELGNAYTLVFKTDVSQFDVNYFVYKRNITF